MKKLKYTKIALTLTLFIGVALACFGSAIGGVMALVGFVGVVACRMLQD